jgi:hypothetical protein
MRRARLFLLAGALVAEPDLAAAYTHDRGDTVALEF